MGHPVTGTRAYANTDLSPYLAALVRTDNRDQSISASPSWLSAIQLTCLLTASCPDEAAVADTEVSKKEEFLIARNGESSAACHRTRETPAHNTALVQPRSSRFNNRNTAIFLLDCRHSLGILSLRTSGLTRNTVRCFDVKQGTRVHTRCPTKRGENIRRTIPLRLSVAVFCCGDRCRRKHLQTRCYSGCSTYNSAPGRAIGVSVRGICVLSTIIGSCQTFLAVISSIRTCFRATSVISYNLTASLCSAPGVGVLMKKAVSKSTVVPPLGTAVWMKYCEIKSTRTSALASC